MELIITDLLKIYRNGTRALDNLSLILGNGMFGLLGPNGAGKSTLMKILATLLEPTSGRVTFDGMCLGRDNQEIRRSLGYLPQEFGFYPNLTAREILDYMANLHDLSGGKERQRLSDDILEQVNLTEVADQRVGGFSGGMRQRLGIAQAILNQPKLLIVDEPTAGLDPEGRIRFRNLLRQLSSDRIVILATHIVADISSSCDDMALLEDGKIQFRGRPADLISQVAGNVWQTVVSPTEVNAIGAKYQVVGTVRTTEGVSLRILSDPNSLHDFTNLQAEEPTLEDAYLWVKNQPTASEARR